MLFFVFFISITLLPLTVSSSTLNNNTPVFSDPDILVSGYAKAKKKQHKEYLRIRQDATNFLGKGDTLEYVKYMIKLSDIDRNIGEFNRAFDILWEILPVAERISDQKQLIKVHRGLGVLYGYYQMDSLSLLHMKQGLEIDKKNKSKAQNGSDNLATSYVYVAVRYISIGDDNTALKYLDSCYLSVEPHKKLYYVDMYYGHIYTKLGKLDMANKYLSGIVPHPDKKGNSSYSIVYHFQGEFKEASKELDSAMYYYKKSLASIDSFQTNIRLKPTLLEKIGLLYIEMNNETKALEYMQAAKSLSDSVIITQRIHNKILFELKSRYKKELLGKSEMILAQNKLIEAKNKAGLRLKQMIVILILLAGASILVLKQRSRMKQIVYEKAVEIEKNKEILEVKNRELTVYALEVIDKERTIKELLETIKENVSEKYNILNNTYTINSKKLWDDFHLRFTQVNDGFYKCLKELQPDLTPTDLKHCALIKLNFDSKEMSQILGISLHSVHLSRSRIRKKLNLSRDSNLSDFIVKIN